MYWHHEDDVINKYFTTKMFVTGVQGHIDSPERVIKRMDLATVICEAGRQSFCEERFCFTA